MPLHQYMLFCGAGAALGSLGALVLAAKAERQPLVSPVNASSHWLLGDEEARNPEPDLVRTGVGGATNVAAAMMWGGLLGARLHRRKASPREIMKDGAPLGVIAGGLDYGILPRRLSPGWELVLSGRSVAFAIGGMAAGATLGGLVANAMRRRRG